MKVLANFFEPDSWSFKNIVFANKESRGKTHIMIHLSMFLVPIFPVAGHPRLCKGGQSEVGTSAISDRGCVSLGSLTMKPRDRT